VVNNKGLTVLVDRKASLFLIGTVMDYEVKALASGLTFTNPNEKSRCGCGESFHV
jgi:iron-sulfur cluster assembly protein